MKTLIRSRREKYIETSWYNDNGRRFEHITKETTKEIDNSVGRMALAINSEEPIIMIDNYVGEHTEYIRRTILCQ